MEYFNGKQNLELSELELVERLAGFKALWLDLGTGDGRFVEQEAKGFPANFIIGLDACGENLALAARRAPRNTLYLVANAEKLPEELSGRVDRITINFPWGSLLQGLLEPASKIHEGILKTAHPGTKLQIRLNGRALSVAGFLPAQGAGRVSRALQMQGFEGVRLEKLEIGSIRAFPTTWAKRLGYGRDPQAFYLEAAAPEVSLKRVKIARRN